MANSRDFTGKNRKFTGTKGITVSKGTTAERVGSESGELRFNTTTELMEYFDGTAWKPIDAPPSISSITTNDATGSGTILNADGSTIYTVTINGGNFGVGVNVQFIGDTGTVYTAGNITRVSASQITCTTLSSMGTSDDPYDIKVINVSGLSIESLDALTFNAPPVFVNASGVLGNVWNGRVVSGTTLNAGATDTEGNTITYSIVSGSLPGSGLTLSSSTGAITGTLSGSPSLGNYPFVVRASTTEGFVERQFSIQVVEVPFVAATGGTILTCGDFKTHVFTGPGTFTVTNAGTPLGSNSVEYLVVAGGAGGASGKCNSDGNHGGGGAGGYRTNYPSPSTAGLPVSATAYPITAGGGGGGGSGPNCNPTSRGGQGSNSVFSNITSAGGGGGNSDSIGTPQPVVGFPGGSGGGGSGQPAGLGGIGNTPPVSPPQGNNGGNGNNGPGAPNSGGGGGAGAAGENGATQGGSTSGRGAVGATIATAFFGPTAPSYGTAGPAPGRYFAGGGSGGRSNNVSAGGAPPGGGGGGGSPNGPGNIGISGTINTGGGGGASGSGLCGNAQGGAGASGIVVIRYKFQ